MLPTFPMLVSDNWTLQLLFIVLMWHLLAEMPILSGSIVIVEPCVLLRTRCPGHTLGLRASILVRKVVGQRCPSYVERHAGRVNVVVRVP